MRLSLQDHPFSLPSSWASSHARAGAAWGPRLCDNAEPEEPACPSSHSCEGWKSQNPLPASVAPITGHRKVDGFTQHKIMLLPSGSQKVQNQFQRTEGQVSSGLAPSAAASLGPGPRSTRSTYPSLWGQSSPCFPLTGTRVVLVRASWITWGYRPPGDP